MKNKFLIRTAALIGLLLAAGLVLLGCEQNTDKCPGDGNCTITYNREGESPLYHDTNHPTNSCGNLKSDVNSLGCKVAEMVSGREQKLLGSHNCTCYW